MKIGIDEHRFGRDSKTGQTRFATFFVSHSRNKRAFEIVEGRTSGELRAALERIPGREQVRLVTMDMSGPYRSFARSFFPNATIVADKFHVLRLLNLAIIRARKEITGDRRSLKVRKLLLMNGSNLNFWLRSELMKWLDDHPKLRELYLCKEALHGLCRCRGHGKAKALLNWRKEVLAFFIHGHTNARVEGFNNVAKTIIKRGYGYQSFENYRLRVLRACC